MNVWQRIDSLARDVMPFAVTIVLTIISILPLRISGGGSVTPILSLAAFFYWRVTRPDLMPALAAFVIGLAQDTLSATPLGLHALVYLLIAEVMASRRFAVFRESFMSMWLGFTLIAAGTVTMVWLLNNLLNLQYADPDTYVAQLLVTLFAFPPLAWAFAAMRRHFLQ